MPYRGPSVLPQPLDLGSALTGGLDRFLQARQLRDERDELAQRTGIGIAWPTPTANPPVSIMGTAAPVPDTQSAPSAPLSGVHGLPSPGRVQGMNMPQGDLGPALQTGQRRQIGGVAQPHDELREAISNIGKQVNGGNTPVMSLASQSYTPPPTSPPMDENTMLTLPSGRQIPYGQTSFGRQQALLGERIGGQYGMQNLRGQQRTQQIALTTQGRLAVVDDQNQARDLLTGALIDSRELIAGNRNATNIKTTGMRDATTLEATDRRDATSLTEHNTPSGTAIYRTDHPPAGRAASPESQPHFLLKRVPQLMKPVYEGGMGLSQDAAEQQATSEYNAANPPARAPLSDRDKQMAKTHPDFAAHLASQGYTAGTDY